MHKNLKLFASLLMKSNLKYECVVNTDTNVP